MLCLILGEWHQALATHKNDRAWSSDITLLGLAIDETSSLENVSNTDAIDVIAGNSSLANISSYKEGVNFDFSIIIHQLLPCRYS